MAFKLQPVCVVVVVVLALSVGSSSAKSAASMRAIDCSASDDLIGCTKQQFVSFLDSVFQKDSFKVQSQTQSDTASVESD